MKTFSISLYLTLSIFSSNICAVSPDNGANIIRRNAVTAISYKPSFEIDSKPYSVRLDNNRMVVIPAGRTLTMPPDDARSIITQIVNYNGVQEAGKIKIYDNTFILE